MNQGSETDIVDNRQRLKYTTAKMRKILAQVAASQEDHEQPQDVEVSIL
jgi:hypothetical protein